MSDELTYGRRNAVIIENHKSKLKQQRRQWQRYAAAFRSEFFDRDIDADETGFGEETEEGTARENNRLFAFVDSVVANICPNNPKVSIKARVPDNEAPAAFRTALLTETYRRQKFHQKLWSATTRSCVFPRSFIKVVWDRNAKFPRIRVINPHYVFYDTDAEAYEDVRYICEATVISREEFQRRIKTPGRGNPGVYLPDVKKKATFGKFPGWLMLDDKERGGGQSAAAEATRAAFQWITVYEFYDFERNKFHHYIDDVKEPIFTSDLPYKHVKNPYVLMSFNDNLKDLGGLSDAHLIFPNLERLNELDTLEMRHNKSSIPTTFFNKNAVDDPSNLLDGYLDNAEPGGVLPVSVKQGRPLSDVFHVSPMPTLPVNWGISRENTSQEITHTLGMPDYQRGDVGGSDVATAFALADTAARTRNERRKKVVYDVMIETSNRVIGLFAQFLEDEDRIYTRMLSGDTVIVTPRLLGFDDDADYDPNAWDYEAHAFNAQEGNDVVQLKSLEAFLPVLINSPAVNQTGLMHKLLDLLGLQELKASVEAQQAQQVPAPGMPGAAPGTPAEMAPDMLQQAEAGQVLGGTGEQSVESPLEGGTTVVPGRPTMAG